jgi:hypothetical protein
MSINPSNLISRWTLLLFLGAFYFSNACYAFDTNASQAIVTDRLKNLKEAIKIEEHMGPDWVAGHLSLAGDSFAAIKKYNERYKKNSAKTYDWTKEHVAVANAEVSDAISEIVNAAKDRQIVILNEAHHVSMHRAFAMRLARELRKIGYEYLACETFVANDPAPLNQGYVNSMSGFYTRETMFANFLNDAIKDQWKFFSFERKRDPNLSSSENAKLRDLTMAQNIIRNVLDQNPKAKIFIYTGYGHASKTISTAEKMAMAGHLKVLSNIDPLTIDQTTLFEHVGPDGEHELYEDIVRSKTQNTPFMLKSSDQQFLRFVFSKSSFDMQVTYPKYRIDPSTGRPEWMQSLAGFKPYSIPENLIPTEGTRLIYAFRKNDPLDAMPVDLVLVEAGKPKPKLMLPEGEYRFAFEENKVQ